MGTFFCKHYFLLILLFTVFLTKARGQATGDTLAGAATLAECIQYALTRQPAVKQYLIDESITDREVRSKIADWYPQVNTDFNYQRNFQLQTSIFQGSAVKIGTKNTSSGLFSATQNLFNRDALLAFKTAGTVRRQARENTVQEKIRIHSNVSKAFYDVLLTTQQIAVYQEDQRRLEASLRDATNQYRGGLADNTDYKRATISLNNTNAQLKGAIALLEAKDAYLKEQMGYPGEASLRLAYDSLELEQGAKLDTAAEVDFRDRIEYRQYETQQALNRASLAYYKWSFLPAVSLFGEYNLNYLNDRFPKLYAVNYPNSYAGIQVSLPIFQGGKRLQNIQVARLQIKRTVEDIAALKNSVNASFRNALAAYKSSLVEYQYLKMNLQLSQEVYHTIQLQYRSGVKTYLEVITAEADLRTSRINYVNALFQLLSDKVDVERELGQIKY